MWPSGDLPDDWRSAGDLDAVHDRVADQLDQDVLDRATIGLGHLVMTAAGHHDFLAVIIGDAIGELLRRGDEAFARRALQRGLGGRSRLR